MALAAPLIVLSKVLHWINGPLIAATAWLMDTADRVRPR
jgi:hypothetical protein